MADENQFKRSYCICEVEALQLEGNIHEVAGENQFKRSYCYCGMEALPLEGKSKEWLAKTSLKGVIVAAK